MRLGGRAKSDDNVMLTDYAGPSSGKSGAQAVGGKYKNADRESDVTSDHLNEIHVQRDFEVTVETLWENM